MAAIVSIFIITMLIKLLYFNHLIGGTISASYGLLMSSIGALMILICLIPIVNKQYRMKMLIFFDAIITFIAVADLLFYRYFNDVITLPMVAQIKMAGSVSSSIFNLFHISDLLFILDFLLLIPLLKKIRSRQEITKPDWIYRTSLSLVLLLSGIFLSYRGIVILEKDQPNILTTFYDKAYIAQNIGLINYHGVDAFKFFKEGVRGKKTLSDDEKAKINTWFKEKQAYMPDKLEYFGAAKGKNLIAIQVEALQEFVIGRKINGNEITPNLNRLINKSIYFENYFCETAAGGTSDAEFLANNSLYPLKTGAVFMKYPGNYYFSLPKALKEQGYATVAMHAYKPGFWNRSVMYPNMSFDKFFNKNDLIPDEIIGMGLSDKSFFRQSLDYLKTIKEPYYAFMVTLTSHYPYDNTESYHKALDVGDLKGAFMGNYLEAIHYADESLGYLIDRLEKEGMMDNTVVAVYGDHYAVSKDKKNELARLLNIDDMNDYMWVKHQKVPLIIHLPGDEGAGRRSIAGGGLDFMPTILNIMGVDGRAIPMMGRDLLNSPHGMAVMRNGYFIDDDYLCLTADGAAFKLDSGEPYPIENLKKEIEDMHMELDISEKIIENDLIEEIRNYLLNQ
ncbi:LTA synthase family protein [Lutispora saccharofermentans]|uniref:LTA synthase family protein n=1 Tax=Lutispora saccharofermentans TaxID=3024236 RepID=A0ABT1NHP0_9FIRM|nr:LTA synthase family protein [Lutispora saccharofermentans]MCQ1530805.1 LTA synthase family protein [Lutispora saccharofermentans]